MTNLAEKANSPILFAVTLAGFLGLCWYCWPDKGYDKADVQAVNDLVGRYVKPSLHDRQVRATANVFGMSVPSREELAEWKDVAKGRF